MKQTLLALFLATSTPTIAAEPSRTGTIDTGRAIKLFEQLREAVIAGKLEEEKAGGVELRL